MWCGRQRRIGWITGTLAAAALSCPLPAGADEPGVPFLGLSEIRLGALYHDVPGLWSGFSVEQPAADANVEVLFSPWARTFGGYLRPAIGTTLNFNGETSKAYADLRWETETASGIFFALGMGVAVHNGNTDLSDPSRKALGFPVLFHPSAEIGYRIDGVHSVSIFADHISNGFTRQFNEGMDTVGVRFGRRLVPLAMDAPPDLPAGDFSGFYVGAFAGYQYERADWYTATPVASVESTPAWGGYAGYNWQADKGIFGLEVDASPAARSLAVGCAAGISCDMDVHGVYGMRARFGWVIDRLMLYGSGGVAVTPWDSAVRDIATSVKLDHASGLNYGVTVGAGIEYKPSQNFGVRAELVHYGVAGWDLSVPPAGATMNQFQSYVGRIGFTWYFK